MAKLEGWQHNLLWIVVILAIVVLVLVVIGCIFFGIASGIIFLGERYPTLVNELLALYISFLVGWAAFEWVICPKKKRGQPANRITAVVALLTYLLIVLAAIFVPGTKFNLNLFWTQGLLVGAITMGIIYAIAQFFHWATKGKWM